MDPDHLVVRIHRIALLSACLSVWLAAQLGPGWNSAVWDGVAQLVANKDKRGQLTTPPSPSQPRRQEQNRLTPDRAAALVTDYEAGASIAEVARSYGVHVNTATRHVTSQGLTIRRPHPIPEEDLETARALYDAGWSYAKIGKKYGCSRTTVSNQLNGCIQLS